MADALSRLCPNLTESALPLRTEELELLPSSSSSFTVSALTVIEPASDDQLEYIQMCHNAIVGHNGVDRTLTRLFSLQQVWKHMKQHVRTFIQNCPCCQKLSAKDPKINASHFATSNYAIFDTLNVDYIGPFPDKGYILVNLVTHKERSVHIKNLKIFNYDSEVDVPAETARCDYMEFVVRKVHNHSGDKKKPTIVIPSQMA